MNSVLGPLAAFVAILVLIPVALWLLKRTPMGGAAMGGLLRVVSALPLAPNQRILIVEVGQGEARQWLVLGATPAGISTAVGRGSSASARSRARAGASG